MFPPKIEMKDPKKTNNKFTVSRNMTPSGHPPKYTGKAGEQDWTTYCLLIEKPDPSEITVGKLGTFAFRAGFYVYTGSAKRTLKKRIQRHRSNDKTLHWHIDYLLEESTVIHVYLSSREECDQHRRLQKRERAQMPVERFGSSDCDCRSHLLYFSEKPTMKKSHLKPLTS